MRIANVNGRLTISTPSGHFDVEEASSGRFGPDPQAVYQHWEEFVDWADHASLTGTGFVPERHELGAPAPRPTQVFAIGLNYALHAAESGVDVPKQPPTFTKFQTCITGPVTTVELTSEANDWEVELVVVIGKRADRVPEADAWAHVAGLTVGQDLSDRSIQLIGPVPQFSLAKSFAGFGPTGPELVTVDEVPDRDNLELGCSIDGEIMQKGRTEAMIFSVSQLISRLSAVCVLLPGDIIFTGTPDGVGMGRQPQRFLQPGEVLHSWIEGIGTLDTTFVAKSDPDI